MPKKTVVKKKAYKAAQYRLAKSGKINAPDGSMVPIPSGDNSGMIAGYRAGYHIR